MKNLKTAVLITAVALSTMLGFNANASVSTDSNINVQSQPKSAELSYLTNLVHSVTDTTVYWCKLQTVNRDMPKDVQDKQSLACELEGMKAFTAISICAVYDNTNSVNNERSDQCFTYAINKYVSKYKPTFYIKR